MLRAALVGSWQYVSDCGFGGKGPTKATDYFHRDQSSWDEFGDSRGTSHSIIYN